MAFVTVSKADSESASFSFFLNSFETAFKPISFMVSFKDEDFESQLSSYLSLSSEALEALFFLLRPDTRSPSSRLAEVPFGSISSGL